MLRFRRILGLLFCGLLSGLNGAMAAEVSQLYSVIVPVVDQSDAAKKAAEIEAMKAVLIKVSGSSAVLTMTGVTENLPKAPAYIQRFQYQQLDSAVNYNGVETRLRLEFSFDGRAIERLLQSASAPIWGLRRPLVLIWLVVQDETGRHIIGSDDNPELTREWNEAAALRGVPSVLPLFDLEESNAIQVADVYGRFIEPLQLPSKKYGAEAMLVGRLEKNQNNWQGLWTFAQGNLRKSISAEGSSTAQVLQSAMAQIAETLAQKYAVVVDPSKESEVLLTMHSLHTVQDYGAVQNLLQGLQVVRQVDAREVVDDTVVFAIRLIADVTLLQQALSADTRLQLTGNELSNALEYTWQP